MKIDAPLAAAPSAATYAPLTAPPSMMTLAPPIAPLPAVGATMAPLSISARLDGASEKLLRAVLAKLKEDVSPKSLRLALNKLATHARRDVHAALEAMLGSEADAVARHVAIDTFDFARAALKEIEGKLGPRVIDTNERVIDFTAGAVAGAVPLPPPPAPFAHAFEYALGQRVGAAVGLAGDVAALLVGGSMATGGGAAVVASAGALSLPAGAVSAAGVAVVSVASAGAAIHGARLLEPQRAAVFEARATELGNQPRKLNEAHTFSGEVRAGVEKPSSAMRAERKRLRAEKRPLSANEQKVFTKKPIRIARGFHLESSGGENARVIEATRSAADRHRVYMASVEIRDPVTGRWICKRPMSSFFPASYSEEDVRRAIGEAYGSAVRRDDGSWLGVTTSGMRIVLVVDEGDAIASAYPLMEVAP